MRIRRIVVAALAAVTLIALLVGVPTLLLAGVGNPVPEWSTLRSGNLDDSTVLRLLACVVWIAWLQWLPGTLLEIADARHRRNPTPAGARISEPRHVSAGQGLSRMLVTAVLGVSIVGSLVTHTARAAASPALEPPPAAAAHLASSTPTPPPAQGWTPRPAEQHSGQRHSGPIYVVGSDPSVGPSLWSIAQHTMGNPLRWREIWELNRGRSQPGGAVFTSPEDIQNGWQLRLPADATAAPPPPATPPRSQSNPARTSPRSPRITARPSGPCGPVTRAG